MPIDYLSQFPIPVDLLPKRLRELFEPVGNSPSQAVEVTSRYDFDTYGPKREAVQMVMAVVPDDGPEVTPSIDESGSGVVSFSVPSINEKGKLREFMPSISGYDYIVASWGNGSFYAYNLSEKVWMGLGLTPRCVGNDGQRIIYDDLALPEFAVAEGEVSTEFYWSSKRNVAWKMSNEYLRKYLWMRGAYGVRVFFYETLLADCPELRRLMGSEKQVLIREEGGWYELDIREHEGALLIQIWATVKAVSPELCPEQNADAIEWPGFEGVMTRARANALIEYAPVYLDDRFLEKYEQNSFYKATPAKIYNNWWCSPSYRGQWHFTECIRVGRNVIRVPMRELYKAKPDREILWARTFVVEPAIVATIDLQEEHVVSKVQRLLDQLLDLGENLSRLGMSVGLRESAVDLIRFSRQEIYADGWTSYPQLARLAQVTRLDMTQQAFLSRCKSLHEIWQQVPDGFLKSLLQHAGCQRAAVKQLGNLKLLQALLNIVMRLNKNKEALDAFEGVTEPEGWRDRNSAMALLFLNNDLRIADAHETMDQCLGTLESLGFDIANVNQGYGRALDFVMDGVISAFTTINLELSFLLGG